jgi:hypothetical protein
MEKIKNMSINTSNVNMRARTTGHRSLCSL